MFTEEEERILKLIVAELKARMKLNIANEIMGNEIRTEFSTIDAEVRAKHEATITPLQIEAKTCKDNLIAEFK